MFTNNIVLDKIDRLGEHKNIVLYSNKGIIISILLQKQNHSGFLPVFWDYF